MRAYSLTHLNDATLLEGLSTLVARGCENTALTLAHIGEVDDRKLYLPAGYDSMFAYCVGVLHFSPDAARKRVHAARVARRFPAIFQAVAQGKLHLSAVVMLAPHLGSENADELLVEATHKSKSEIEELLAQRFPKLDVPYRLTPAPSQSQRLTLGQRAPGRVPITAPCASRAKVSALSAGRFELTVTIDQSTRDLLSYAAELLSHSIPSGSMSHVLHHVVETAVREYEKRKFAATRRRRTGPQARSADPRHVPAAVKEAVWKRDQGQCTFVGTTGHRCASRKFLEYDHVVPVARGGEATVEGLRLRCRAHNQFEAERMFGAGFMEEKREASRRIVAETRARSACAGLEPRIGNEVSAEAAEQARDVYAGLRDLRVPVERAKSAAAFSATIPNATLEERMRAALKYICPKTVVRRPAYAAAAAVSS